MNALKKIKRKKIVRYPRAQEQLFEYKKSLKKQSVDYLFSKKELICFYIFWLLLFGVSVVYALIRCKLSYIRFGQSVLDIGTSFVYYFTLIVPFEFDASVIRIPDIPIENLLPVTFVEFGEKFNELLQLLFTWENFQGYLLKSAIDLGNFSRIAIVFLPFIIALKVIVNAFIDNGNVEWNVATKPYKIYMKLLDKVYYPVKNFLIKFSLFNTGHYILEFFYFFWLCNLNVVTVLAEALAYYIYFSASFDFVNLYTQVVKFLMDIAVFLKASFFVLTVVLIYKWISLQRTKFAYISLLHKEKKVEEFAESLPLALLITAPPGVGKTTFLVNLGLTVSLRFRNEALSRLIKYYSYFPDFPWLKLEKKLMLMFKRHDIYNLATIEAFIASERYYFDCSPVPACIYGYDINKYRMTYNDGINDIFIWDAIENYAKLFFIYTIESSLIVSNFPIREDYMIENCGNFILFENNVFTHPVSPEFNHFSHILNFDSLRVGKTMVNDPNFRNSFEFGMLAVTEGGKEFGSHFDNIVVKRDAQECNVKNDLIDLRMKMSRHPAVVDNFVFVHWLLDEQRATSLDPNIRDCCDVILLKSASERKLAYPLYYFEAAIYDFLKSKYDDLYKRYRFSHGNRTLCGYLAKHLMLMILQPIERILYKFAYKNITFKRWNLASEDEKIEEKLPLCFLKVYKSRFPTDTHAQFFRKRALKAGFGINDYPTYTGVLATDMQLHAQGSHFIKKMDDLNRIDDEHNSTNKSNE